MFNLGFSEVILIFVIALVFIGPKQLPQVAKFLGRLAGDVKRAMGDFNQEINKTVKSANEEITQAKSEIEKPIETSKDENV
ncbi:MAG: twin-arginine translocase subunit TatB [Bdellovibrionales bacterium]|nr:twin-arginine translocase subunit TatB [Bdellovibrionales bacterium]